MLIIIGTYCSLELHTISRLLIAAKGEYSVLGCKIPHNTASSFQLSVGAAGTSNKTVRAPKNFTLKAPGPGYTCGPARVVRPSKFITADKRRVTQALSKLMDITMNIL